MTGADVFDVRRRRLRRAVGVVVLGAVCVALSSPIEHVAAYAADALTSLSLGDGSGQTLAWFSLEEGVEVSAPDQLAVREEVSSEVWLPADARDVYCLVGGSVVGFTESGDADSIQSAYESRMEEMGWMRAVVGGDVAACAFVKAEGSCRYVLATFTQVESDVCVVLRIESED